jgi:hypothetical protein
MSIQKQFLGIEWFVQAWPPITNPQGPQLSGLFEGLDQTG